MNRFLIPVSAAAVALSTSATADVHSIRFERDTAHIDYRDLDLASHDGRAQLVGRIRKGAERICADYDGGVLSFAKISQCYQVLVRSGIEQMEKITSPASWSSGADGRRSAATRSASERSRK